MALQNEAATNNASANGSDRRQFGELMALRRAKDAAASGNPLSPEQSQLLAAISAAGGHKAAVTAVLAGNGASIFGRGGPGGRGGSAGTGTSGATGGGSGGGGGGAAPVAKSRRKGGAPSRAAD